VLTTVLLGGGWVPETSWSFHYWQPTPRWRLHQWLGKPDNPTMSPQVREKAGTHHTDKVESKGVSGKWLNAPRKMLLLPVTLIK